MTTPETKDSYYQRNKDAIQSARVERYHSDPDYRQRVISQNAESAARRRQREQKERDQRDWKTIQEASEVLSIPVATLRSWQNKGYFPKPGQGKKVKFPPQALTILADLRDYLSLHSYHHLDYKQVIDDYRARLNALNWE